MSDVVEWVENMTSAFDPENNERICCNGWWCLASSANRP